MKSFRELSKVLSRVENGGTAELSLLRDLYKNRRGTPILGVTGLPGSGKSTLTDQLIGHLRGLGKKVGVLAVDPSSPFSGGALLGDRVRMQRHATDEGVFIRSLGSRGAHGGLSRATRNVTLAMSAYGFDQILVETVGVGQTELDIMGLATVTAVVLTPESGDAIQTLKAGLMEIGDLFVVNKADRDGAKRLAQQLQAMTHESFHSGEAVLKAGHAAEVVSVKEFEKPVLLTTAIRGEGIRELWDRVESLQMEVATSPEHRAKQERITRNDFITMLCDRYRTEAEEKYASLIEKVASGELNPFEALEQVAGGRVELPT